MRDEVRVLMLDLAAADEEVLESQRLYLDAERRLFAARARQSAARKAAEDRMRHAPGTHAPPTCARCGPVSAAEKYLRARGHTTDYEIG